MRITIDRLAGEEFEGLLKYIHRPDNTYELGDNKRGLKVKLREVGQVSDEAQFYNKELKKYFVIQAYFGVEIDVTERQMTPEELSGLMKLICEFKEKKK